VLYLHLFHAALKLLFLILFALFYITPASAQTFEIKGLLVDNSGVLIGATVFVKELNRGTTSDATGKFHLKGISPGNYTLQISMIGYLKQTFPVTMISEVDLGILELKVNPFELESVIVSGSRTERYRGESPVAVDIISAKSFQNTQSQCLADGIGFQSGLRLETDCQTCNYTQLRVNGLGGGYTQILINSRPIFSSLAGLYGLEQIPVNMIDRVEIVKGGGSVLFGSSAIAGTVNVMTHFPKSDEYSVSINQALIESQSFDFNTQVSASQINKSETMGINIFAGYRHRESYDANTDGFSELPEISGLSFGTTLSIRPTDKFKTNLSLMGFQEQRDGGDLLDLVPHKRTQSESRNSLVLASNVDLTYVQNFMTEWMIYGGFQKTDRDHYTGSFGADGYGRSENYTVLGGLQQNLSLNWFNHKQLITNGIDFQYDDVRDEIEAYAYLIDQTTQQTGLFSQIEWRLNRYISLVAGSRYNFHNFLNKPVFTPRFNTLITPFDNWKFRASYGRGFRAPQAFDADMHIAFANGGITRIVIDPNLKSELSDSYALAIDFDKYTEKTAYGFTISSFYTVLHDAFSLESLTTTEDVIILQKVNSVQALVAGISLETRLNLNNHVEWNGGYTWQKSSFKDPVQWSENVQGVRDFLRTPDHYGFYTLSFLPLKKLNASVSGIYTGAMKIALFGGALGVSEDRLVLSESFLETNLKVNHNFNLKNEDSKLQFSVGIQNVFNQYQRDFNIGPNRDSNYVYGPSRPRTVFIALKITG